jgi:23S rRNA (cytosine1962-C5)-methyltransferase
LDTITPTIRLLPRMGRRAAGGLPWIYSNEIVMDGAAKALAPGSLVTIVNDGGEALGVAMFNPHSLISARLMSREPGVAIDRDFLADRLRAALSLREVFYSEPYYRLVHAEADGLPGLIVDRYGDIVVMQPNTAGMDRLTDELADILREMLSPRAVIVRGDSPIRRLERLEERHQIIGTAPDGPVKLIENGVAYLADVTGGQKTGWFYDQRNNRRFMAKLAGGLDVLDVYAHSGGFGLAAAESDANTVTMVDRSQAACELARQAAELGGLANRCTVVQGEAFADLTVRRDRDERFGMVICDPPAFVGSKKELKSGAKGYRKLTRLAARLVEKEGWLAISSCSHHVTDEMFLEQIRLGLRDAQRDGKVVRRSGAGPDHPLHPGLPESAYLKFVCLRLD